jgi:2-iminobutanoate/2-iminopropanoate deaminase
MRKHSSLRWGLGAFLAVAGCAGAPPARPLLVRDIQAPHGTAIGYADVVRHGDQLHVSGVLGWREGTGFSPDLEDQLRAAYDHLRTILDRHGATFADVINEEIFTTDLEGLKHALEARKAIYGAGHFPAATAVQVVRLWEPEAKIEIALIVAVKPPR